MDSERKNSPRTSEKRSPEASGKTERENLKSFVVVRNGGGRKLSVDSVNVSEGEKLSGKFEQSLRGKSEGSEACVEEGGGSGTLHMKPEIAQSAKEPTKVSPRITYSRVL